MASCLGLVEGIKLGHAGASTSGRRGAVQPKNGGLLETHGILNSEVVWSRRWVAAITIDVFFFSERRGMRLAGNHFFGSSMQKLSAGWPPSACRLRVRA